ncbi:hypothetical protein EVAR_39140_1 [Eumeta japonica]|uniref:Uncharacterized protein n=1 Tax=Eumeta variegata TaxID=151549 RepID=A0A4C1X5L6_EUMVA|nr:hypothetical protein EVAR_39140_1 [Eumeta japonica]
MCVCSSCLLTLYLRRAYVELDETSVTGARPAQERVCGVNPVPRCCSTTAPKTGNFCIRTAPQMHSLPFSVKHGSYLNTEALLPPDPPDKRSESGRDVRPSPKSGWEVRRVRAFPQNASSAGLLDAQTTGKPGTWLIELF